MSALEIPVRLDLNNPIFQKALFALPKRDQLKVLATLRKISCMTWNQVHRDSGLRWELIQSREGPTGERLYSFRIGKDTAARHPMARRNSALPQKSVKPALYRPVLIIAGREDYLGWTSFLSRLIRGREKRLSSFFNICHAVLAFACFPSD